MGTGYQKQHLGYQAGKGFRAVEAAKAGTVRKGGQWERNDIEKGMTEKEER
jgi:hypothetical protein